MDEDELSSAQQVNILSSKTTKMKNKNVRAVFMPGSRRTDLPTALLTAILSANLVLTM